MDHGGLCRLAALRAQGLDWFHVSSSCVSAVHAGKSASKGEKAVAAVEYSHIRVKNKMPRATRSKGVEGLKVPPSSRLLLTNWDVWDLHVVPNRRPP